MSPADYGRLYDEFIHTAFRIETRQEYAVHAEDPSLAAFRNGTARPERSVRTSPWLARIAGDVIAGKDWGRVRLVEWPLTEYTRWELGSFIESQAAGERILLAPADQVDYAGPDVWLFDLDTDHACAVETIYTDDGAVQDRILVTDPDRLADLRRARDQAVAVSQPLNEFLAREAMAQRV